jgi:hypothetical protein
LYGSIIARHFTGEQPLSTRILSERLLPPNCHRERVRELCGRLAEVLADAPHFEISAEGDWLQVRVSGQSARSLLRQVLPAWDRELAAG